MDKKTQVSISKRLQVNWLQCNLYVRVLLLQNTKRQIHKTQVYGGKSSIRGATSGTASSVAFTPLQVRIPFCL